MLERLLKKTPAFLVVIISLFFVQFYILTFFRFLFYFLIKPESVSTVNSLVIVKAFRMGFEFDLVATTYAILIPVLFLLLNEVFRTHTLFFQKVARIATLLIYLIYSFVSVADIPYYKQFGTHLTNQAMVWGDSPTFIFRLIIGNFSYWGYLFFFVFMAILIAKIVNLIFDLYLIRMRDETASKGKIVFTSFLLSIFLLLGARGRSSPKSTTHEGLAIVSENQFVNQIALNPNFTFFKSALFHKNEVYKVPSDIDADFEFAKKTLGVVTKAERSIERFDTTGMNFRAYNVVIVCMESMSFYKIGKHTPNFNRLINESVYFDRFFSSGIHTFNGLFSSSTGYPSLLKDHGLKQYLKRPFVTLATLLKNKGYQTIFSCTHDPHFDNMNGFFVQNGYTTVLSSLQLPPEKSISATGVADHEIFDLTISKINSLGKMNPFLAYIMTGSDHGPWAIPKDITFKSDAQSEQKRSTEYADWALGQFIENAKKTEWYKNTLFVFYGDHGYYLDGTYEMPLSYNRVPLVIHAPALVKPEITHNLGFQPDVTATVCGLLNLDVVNTTFGKNILKEGHDFVYFTADNKIGCVDKEGYFYYHLLDQKTKRLRKYLSADQKDYSFELKAKADSLEKAAKHMLNAAEYILKKDYTY